MALGLGPAVGRFFHILDANGRIKYQGRILRRRRGGWFVCEFFDFMLGEPSNEEEVHQEVMREGNWVFYDFSFQMRRAYDEAQKAEQ